MQCPPGTFTPEQRRKLLEELVRQKKFVTNVAKELGIARASLYRYLRGEREPPQELDPKLCKNFTDDEVLAVINNKQLLAAADVVQGGQLNVPLLLALIDAAMEHPQAKQVLLDRFTTRYKEELQDLEAKTMPRITLNWTMDFERWLTEKKSKPVSERTLRDYRNVWNLCLEGKTLGWHLLKQLEGSKMLCNDEVYHSTGWARQVFRHYIRYLYAQSKLDWDTYTRLLLLIPGRRYGRKISQKPIETGDVKRTLLVLREKRPDIYTLYLLMLFSAVRFEHTLRMLAEWKPKEKVYVPYLNRNLTRLECFEEFCRYYMGSENDRKPVGFAYFPKPLLLLLEKYRDKMPSKRYIEKVVAKLSGLMPKYVRIYALREMKVIFGETDTWRFITSKFGELSVSARHYMDLLDEADKIYPRYVKHITRVLGDDVEIY